jgi:hypothetical protein
VRTKHLPAIALLTCGMPFSVAHGEGIWSQFVDPDDQRFDASNYLADNAYGFLPVPIIITDPAVDGGLGLAGLFFHESEEEKQQRLDALRSSDQATKFLIPPSASVAAAALTGNDSWFAGGGHMGFFNQGHTRYMVGTGYGDVDLDFFGFGDITLNNPVSINTSAAGLFQSIKFKMGDTPIFAGFLQQYIAARIQPANPGDLGGDFLPPEYQEEFQEIIRQLLTRDVTTSALGLVVEFDNRNNFFSPKFGYKYTLEYLWYRDAIGSDIDYQLAGMSALNYWRMSDRFLAALRVDVDIADAEGLLPPFATPSIVLRGIPAMRYQGKYAAVTEAELTWQVDTRWSINGFIGAGRVANDYDELRESSSQVSKGAGFRYQIARRYGFDMGMDIAFGPEEAVWYIQAGTAW